jgi:cytochrome c-type biogenesis protein CcmH
MSFDLFRVFAFSRETSQGFARKREGAKGAARVAAAMLLLGAIVGGASPVWADSTMAPAPYANTALPDAKQEASAKALMESVRCLVCEGQSIADSDAEMASNMRSMIRSRIARGEQPEAIRSWVSYKPVFDAGTAPLWIAPLMFLAIGLWLARGRFRRRGKR